MALFDAHSRALVLDKYKKDGGFTCDQIVNNDLDGIELAGAAFSDVRIEGSCLTRAVLSKMEADHLTVNQSDCKETDFSLSGQQYTRYLYSYLIKADFSQSRLYGLEFNGCTAHSIDFRRASVINTVFNECEMVKSKFMHCLLMKVSFCPGNKGDLAGLDKSVFSDALLVDCTFQGMNLNQVELKGATFMHCDFSRAQLEGIDYADTHFIACCFDNGTAPAGITDTYRKGESLLNCF